MKSLFLPILIVLMSAALTRGQSVSSVHFGLPHMELGAASLTIQGDSLVLDGIGSSGDDGVHIHLGETRGATVRINAFPESAPNGAERIIKFAHLSGVLQWIYQEKLPVGSVFSTELDEVNGQPRTIEVLIAGEVVARQTGHGGTWDFVVVGPTGTIAAGENTPPSDPSTPSTSGGSLVAATKLSLDFEETQSLESSLPILLPDGRLIQGDQVRIIPEGVPPVGPIEAVGIVGRDCGPIKILGESLRFGGARVRADGDVELSTAAAGLLVERDALGVASGVVVGGDGPSAQIGVGFQLPAGPANVAPGAGLLLSTFGADPSDALAVLDARSDGSELDINLCWNNLLSGSTQVDVSAGANIITSYVDASQVYGAGATDWPKSVRFETDGLSLVVDICWDAPLFIDLPGSGTGSILADRIRLERSASSSGSGSVTVGPILCCETFVTATGLPNVLIDDLSATPASSSQPFPGTSEDLTLFTTEAAFGPPTMTPRKSIPVLTPIEICVRSAFGTFDFLPLLVAVQLLNAAETPDSPFPGIAIDPMGTTGLLVGGAVPPVLLAPGGTCVVVTPPPSFVGLRLLVQGVVPTMIAANGIFASTDAHEITFVP